MTQQQPEQTTSSPDDNLEPTTTGTDESKKVIISRRNNRGCKSKDFYNWPEQSFDDMDSPLAVLQYIQQLIRRDPSNVDEILNLPEGQDLGAWKIEHLRMFCMQLNRLAAKLQECCFPETCNQMTATEQWIFLCAAHKQPNECPAIDYTRHTLDGAASLLNSNKYFPSRVTIKESSVAKLGSVCRRVYRIFSHAYYHHFPVFDEFERETFLCKRFSKFVTIYELMSKDSLIVPADGSQPPKVEAACLGESNTGSKTTDRTDISDDTMLKQESNEPEANIQQSDAKNGTGEKSSEEVSSTQPSSVAWSPSQISTNTIMKGASAKSNANVESTILKQKDAEGNAESSPASKDVVESEA